MYFVFQYPEEAVHLIHTVLFCFFLAFLADISANSFFALIFFLASLADSDTPYSFSNNLMLHSDTLYFADVSASVWPDILYVMISTLSETSNLEILFLTGSFFFQLRIVVSVTPYFLAVSFKVNSPLENLFTASWRCSFVNLFPTFTPHLPIFF
nr:MAG TPA: hypothetical protein [Caudoviricetes sp.]